VPFSILLREFSKYKPEEREMARRTNRKQVKRKKSKMLSKHLDAENKRLRRTIAILKRRVAQLEEAGSESEVATSQRVSRIDPSHVTVGQLAILTVREREVLHNFIEKKSDKIVAATLNLSSQTVHNHMAAILNKLDLASRTHLIAAFSSDQKPPTG
jgi:DNA-binding NarL/FixJ family response regulator